MNGGSPRVLRAGYTAGSGPRPRSPLPTPPTRPTGHRRRRARIRGRGGVLRVYACRPHPIPSAVGVPYGSGARGCRSGRRGGSTMTVPDESVGAGGGTGTGSGAEPAAPGTAAAGGSGQGWGYVLLALAAGCKGFDHFFGLSSSWMRDIGVAHALRAELNAVRLEWATDVLRAGRASARPGEWLQPSEVERE